MARDAHEIYILCTDVDWLFANELRTIGMEEGLVLVSDFTNFLKILNGSNFVICSHD